MVLWWLEALRGCFRHFSNCFGLLSSKVLIVAVVVVYVLVLVVLIVVVVVVVVYD